MGLYELLGIVGSRFGSGTEGVRLATSVSWVMGRPFSLGKLTIFSAPWLLLEMMLSGAVFLFSNCYLLSLLLFRGYYSGLRSLLDHLSLHLRTLVERFPSYPSGKRICGAI